MAKNTANLTNAAAPTPDYLTGRPSDASPAGAGNGTPSNLELLGDLIETGNKLMREAGIAPNNNFDNTSNGFQIFDAIIANIRATAASTTQRGTVEALTQAELNAGTDNTRYVTALLIANATEIIKGAAIRNGDVVKIASGSPQTLTEDFPIGSWDMNALPSMNVIFSGIDIDKIRSVDVMIMNDQQDRSTPIIYDITGAAGAYLGATESGAIKTFLLFSVPGGSFANGFSGNTFTSTGINRGTIYVTYEV